MQKRCQSWMGTVVVVVGLTGCQCCPLTDPYADAIDCIADHEHHFEVLYSPCYDLTRIGRPDWCQCGVNRLLCQCRCDRCKPLPHIVDTTAGAYVGMNCPWDTNSSAQPIESDDFDVPHLDDAEEQLNDAPDSELRDEVRENALDGIPALTPEIDKGSEVPPGEDSLDVPPPQPTEETSLRNDDPAPVLWDLDR